MTLLIFYVDIGNEDGPSFSYLLDQGPISDCSIHVTCNELLEYWFDRGIYLGDGNLLEIVEKYNVTEVLEIHDWYDYLEQKEVKELQLQLCEKYNKVVLTAPTNEEYILVTINQYNELPRKYLIPKKRYRSIPNVIKFMNQMVTYQVETSYQRLLTTYHITNHYYYLFDVIDKDNPQEIASSANDSRLIEI